MTVRLDAPTVAKLGKGDNELMNVIRRNIEEARGRSHTTEDVKTKMSEQACENVTTENPDGSSQENHGVDEDARTDKTYNFWSREATLYLISLYKEHEKELEDPRKVKKDIWFLITEEMKRKNFHFSQNKIECKWRSLVQSHKDMLHSKKETGQKRKCFQFYSEMGEILVKRHDIKPPITAGSGCRTPEGGKKLKFSTASASSSCSSSLDSNLEDEKDERSGKRQSKKYASSNNEVIDYLKEMEKRQTEAWQEREKRKDERADDRNKLLREFLEVFKND